MNLFYPTHDEKIVQSCEVCRMFRRMLTTHKSEHTRIINDWNDHFNSVHKRPLVQQIPVSPAGGWKN